REFLAGAGVAADDHPVDSGASQQAELPGRQRPPSHGHERLREAARGVAEPLGLATRQNDRFHYSASSASTSGVSGSAASGDDARPMPSYSNPAPRVVSGSSRFRPSTITRR